MADVMELRQVSSEQTVELLQYLADFIDMQNRNQSQEMREHIAILTKFMRNMSEREDEIAEFLEYVKKNNIKEGTTLDKFMSMCYN